MKLVTGGTGLIGAHILFDLCQKDVSIRATKRTSSSFQFINSLFEFYSPDNYQMLLEKIQWIDADLNDIDSLIEATKGIEHVYHAAAIVSHQSKDANTMIRSNITGTANLVNACKENGIKKIGHVSSVAALGMSKNGAAVTEHSQWKISKKNSAYAISKHGGEREAWRIHEEGVDVVIVNPSLVTGPGDWNNSSTSIFKLVYNGLKYYTNGSTGFVDVRDVSKSIIQLVESDVSGERFIISSQNLRWKEVFELISDAFGLPHPRIHVTKFKAEMAWRLLLVISWFTGKPSKVTKESARASLRQRDFSNQKIREYINIDFIDIKTSIADTTAFIQDFYVKNRRK
ncbi:MAG TPA: nucleoside-diphosphate sugar epimerase [Flavobacteriales bacterium]|nr:nucleoside-diphosphate sugar epimerase [Flavobacteriales bacterium]|tara:strand:+ start:527 stop:1555 length:1029 start_codon:yes stop_codon:yes gene_type:complete